MQTIKLNGKKLRVSASDERCLLILKESNFASKKSEFVEGRYARYRNTILPRDRKNLADLGISELSARTNGYDFLSPENYARITGTQSTRVRKFFETNPRCRSGIFGNPRRINAILSKLGADA